MGMVFFYIINSVLVFILWYMTRACIPEWRLGWIVQPLGHADPLRLAKWVWYGTPT